MSWEHLDTTDADIIIRSADGRDFRAHKAILSLASPVFRDTFSIPQPPSPEPSSTPVVDVCETGKVLDAFLQCVYPVPMPTIEDFGLVEALVTAADKYEVEVILKKVELWLAAPENLKKDPLRAYAIACSSPALWDLVRVIAKWMTFDAVTDAPPNVLTRLAIPRYHHLVSYLALREKETRRIVNDPSWTIFYTSRCGCKTEARLEIKEEIKKALADAFVSNPLLSEEGAVVLAFKQLSKVRACESNEKCSLVVQGEEYAKELITKLAKMSEESWSQVQVGT